MAIEKCLEPSEPVDLLVDDGNLRTQTQRILSCKQPNGSRADNGDMSWRNTGNAPQEDAAAAIAGFKIFCRSLDCQ